ncbi:MAG: ankyrin repeat domain-containing protein, partial [Proteobacteria bacterium]|nr:ankyrin repeat domain-containing protein [Pseudomonadota bacterium]
NNPNVGPQDPRIQWAENALRETKDKIQNVNNMANSSVNVSSQPLKQVLRRCKLKTETELPSLETALRRSASEGNTQDVELILSQGTDINAQDSAKNKRTALHWAVVGKHKSVIEVLLKEGARTDIFDAFIKTAEDYARESGVEEIKQLFVAVTQEKLNHRKA